MSALRCFFYGHDWEAWKPWHWNAPRIVFASMEYMNDNSEVRECKRCNKFQQRRP